MVVVLFHLKLKSKGYNKVLRVDIFYNIMLLIWHDHIGMASHVLLFLYIFETKFVTTNCVCQLNCHWRLIMKTFIIKNNIIVLFVSVHNLNSFDKDIVLYMGWVQTSNFSLIYFKMNSKLCEENPPLTC